MIERAFGRRYAPDDRDQRFCLTQTTAPTLGRKMWYDSRWCADQGNHPHCVGYAWAHWLLCVPIRQWLDPAGLYRLSQFLDEWPGEDYDGTSVRAGAKVLHQLGFLSRYEWAWDVDTVAQTLLTQGPVVVGTAWTEGMTTPDDHGFIRLTGALQGHHAWLLSGVDTRQGIARAKNSWGTSWGDSGRAWITLSDLDALLKDQGEACLGVEATPRAPIRY
jgi:hypothetical protein